MKTISRILIVFIIFLSLYGFSFAQNYNWITPNKTYLKMYIAGDGMYRINKSDFNNAGINVSNIDPRTVKVFNKGSQIPLYFLGEQDGVFNDNDYFDFYGTRNYGGPTITYDQSNAVAYTTNEYFNQYSDTNIYWIDWDGANGLRFSISSFSTVTPFTPDYTYDQMHFENDKLYSQGQNFSSADYNFLSTEKYRGEGWYWKFIGDNQNLTDTFSLPLLYNTPLNFSLKLFAYPSNRNTGILNEHNLEIRINGTLVTTLVSNDFNRFDTTLTFSTSLLSAVSANTVSFTYVPVSGFSGGVFFDFYEIQYPKKFTIRNNIFSARTGLTDTTSRLFKLSGFNSVNPVNIYDNENNFRIQDFSFNADTLKFTGRSNGKFEIVNNNITKKPFRIKQRSVPDLVSTSNGADYLIVYNSLFTSSAEQLRSYRQSRDNFRSVKAEIEDLYDIFNYGLESPVAVRNFTKYVYDNWQLPKLKFICLFGRGSFDPKKNLSTSVYYRNLIPVYGYPNSDGYFGNVNIGTFFYYDQISTGRLPAYTVTEAQTMVDKIIAYENEPPADWWKTFTYITGGGTFGEQQSHQQRSNSEITTYITSTKISGEAVKIYRTDTSGSLTYNIADSVKNTFNRGTVFVNFRGHAGSHDWEVVMQDPNILSNGNKLPLILSLTCFTGENSKADYRGFGERFIYLGGKGAIGFIGTTGWSFTSSGNDFGTFVTQSLNLDTTRRLGDFLKAAGKSMRGDSLSFNARHTINCYNLLGDPAVPLILPKWPEFSINSNEYKLTNNEPNVNEDNILTIYPKNYGLFADSCKIRFQLLKNNLSYSVKDTIYRNFRFKDSIKYNFKLDSSGIYNMVVTLDKDNWYPKEIETNNAITINIPTKNNTFIPISPADNTVLFKDTVELSALNPNIRLNLNSVRVFMQLDTSLNFNSPLVRSFTNSSISGAVTKFKTYLSVTENNTMYYWRTRAVINNDTTSWSKRQTFIYNNGIGISSPGDPKMRYVNSEIRADLRKIKQTQFSETDFYNTSFIGDEIKLNEIPATLFVRSYGSNAEEASYFSVGNNNIYIDGGSNTGLNLIKVKKLSGRIMEFKNYKMTTSASSDSIVTFLNTFDSTQYLMLLNAAYSGGTVLNPSAKAKLRQFGSIYCDSIHLTGYFHTWSFIGYYGAAHSQVCESFDPCCRTAFNCTACDHWTQSVCSMDVVFRKTSGTVSNIIGPAQTWTDFSWSGFSVPNANLTFDVVGIDRNNNQTLLFSNLTNNNFTDISSVKAQQYPKLNLLAKFSIDTLLGVQSPSLRSLKVNYTPAAELVLDKNSLIPNLNLKDSKRTAFSFNYSNAGFVYIYGTIINVFNGPVRDSVLLLSDTVNSILKMDSVKTYSNNFSTPSFRDSTRIYVQIKPKGDPNEFYSYNNFADFSLTNSGVIATTDIEVLCDGINLKNGDHTRKNPEIKINLKNSLNTPDLNDTTQLSIKLNEAYIPYFLNSNINPALNTKGNDKSGKDNNSYSLMFYPQLNEGSNKLSFVYKTGSADFDTLSYDVIVSDRLSISDIYNYPNPMKGETNFVFNITGPEDIGKVRVKLYSVSGKLIRELEYIALSGVNQILWDGKDADGDFVANGTYLYKIVVDNNSDIESKVQKLVVLK